jgi:hypothetical protein
MIFTIATHAIAFIAGAGGVFIYLHKHQTAAIAAANNLASAVTSAKADLAAAKKI